SARASTPRLMVHRARPFYPAGPLPAQGAPAAARAGGLPTSTREPPGGSMFNRTDRPKQAALSCSATSRTTPRGNVMSDSPERLPENGTSRQRYRNFVQDYKQGRLYNPAAAGKGEQESNGQAGADTGGPAPGPGGRRRGKRRGRLREYLRWLWPHRYRVG